MSAIFRMDEGDRRREVSLHKGFLVVITQKLPGGETRETAGRVMTVALTAGYGTTSDFVVLDTGEVYPWAISLAQIVSIRGVPG